MNFKSKLATLAVLGTIGMSAVAGATTVGVVDMAKAYNAYPGFGAIQMQAQKVEQQYGPQLQKEQAKIQAMTDKEKQQKAINEKYVPLVKQYQEAMAKVMAPVEDKFAKAVEEVFEAKKANVIVADPAALSVMMFEKDSKVVDVTPDIAEKMK